MGGLGCLWILASPLIVATGIVAPDVDDEGSGWGEMGNDGVDEDDSSEESYSSGTTYRTTWDFLRIWSSPDCFWLENCLTAISRIFPKTWVSGAQHKLSFSKAWESRKGDIFKNTFKKIRLCNLGLHKITLSPKSLLWYTKANGLESNSTCFLSGNFIFVSLYAKLHTTPEWILRPERATQLGMFLLDLMTTVCR